MSWLKVVVLLLALLEGGWLAFDGGRALMVGDYVTPKSGPHAGQLGPWAALWRGVGIEPRSTLVKSVHLILGVVWLFALVAFARGTTGAWGAMLTCAVLGVWYLPFGTLLSLVQIVLLLLPAVRAPGS